MIRFIKDLINGEPALFVGVVGTAGSAAVSTLATLDMGVPLWLAVGVPVWIAAGSFYTRNRVTPLD